MPASSETTRRSSRDRLELASVWLVLVGIISFAVWVRWPGFRQGGFASHDVAGILYNAMVLEAGGLPYVDTIEIKAPGTFYLAKWLAGAGGRDIAVFQVWANVWGIGSLVCVCAIAWRNFGRAAAIAAGVVYVLHDANLDSIDANYVTWANLPQILAMGLALEGRRFVGHGWEKKAALAWLGAGLACAAAALLKRPDGIVLLAVLAAALWPSDGAGEKRRPDLIAGAWVGTGLLAGHLPIALHYTSQGAFAALIDGYVLNRWGLRYVAEKQAGFEPTEAVLATAFFVALPLFGAVFSVARAKREAWKGPLVWLVLWALMTLVAAYVGGRFYKGYFVATLAPLSILSAAPWGVFGRIRWRPAWARALVLVPAAILAYRAALGLGHTRTDRWRPHDVGGRTIAEHVVENTEPDDRVWVWGWHLWDVYALSGRYSGSRIYKSLGLLTPPNDDTWRRKASPPRFVDGEYAQMLLEDLERERPAYIVLGSTVPHREFEDLTKFLRREYRRDRRVRIGKVQFWRLREPRSDARQ